MGQKSELFKFDYVASDTYSQEQIFSEIGKPNVDMCLKGYNCTILAYGQSGTGKTYTIQGNEEGHDINNTNRGLIPRCLEFLFSEISKSESQTLKYSVKAAFIQIHNESIYDLANCSTNALKLVEDRSGNMSVDSVTEVVVDNPEKALDFFYKSTKNRIISSTKLNAESSRSHCVFTLTITSHVLTPTGISETLSKFNLVDLAGSESQKKAPTSGKLREQAISINKSLSTLGTVINTLVNTPKGRTAYVRYRDSKLTHLLKDSLGGNSLTSIIGNISPCSSAISETISTLRFVKRAKMIQNSAKVNRDFKVSVPQLQAEIEKLKKEISNLNTKLEQKPISRPFTETSVTQSMFLQEHEKFNLIQDQYKDHPLFQICKKLSESNEVLKREKLQSEEKIAELQNLYQRQKEQIKVKELTNRVKELTQLEVHLTQEEIKQVAEMHTNVKEINSKILASSHKSEEDFERPLNTKSTDHLNQPSFGASNGDIFGIVDMDASEIFNDAMEASGFMEISHNQGTLLKNSQSDSPIKSQGQESGGFEFIENISPMKSESNKLDKSSSPQALALTKSAIKTSTPTKPQTSPSQNPPEASQHSSSSVKDSNTNSLTNNKSKQIKNPFEKGVITMDFNDLDTKKSNIKGGSASNLSQILEEKIIELKTKSQELLQLENDKKLLKTELNKFREIYQDQQNTIDELGEKNKKLNFQLNTLDENSSEYLKNYQKILKKHFEWINKFIPIDNSYNLDNLLTALKACIDKLYKEVLKMLDDQNSISEIIFEDNSGYAVIDPNKPSIDSQPKELDGPQVSPVDSKPKESTEVQKNSLDEITLMDGETGNTSDFSSPILFVNSEDNLNPKSSLHPPEFKAPATRLRFTSEQKSFCFEGLDMSIGNLATKEAVAIPEKASATKKRDLEAVSFDNSLLSFFSSQESIPLSNSADQIKECQAPSTTSHQVQHLSSNSQKSNMPTFPRAEPWRESLTKETLERLKKSKATIGSGFRNLDRQIVNYFKTNELGDLKTDEFSTKFEKLKEESVNYEQSLKELGDQLNLPTSSLRSQTYKLQFNDLQNAFKDWEKFKISIENSLLKLTQVEGNEDKEGDKVDKPKIQNTMSSPSPPNRSTSSSSKESPSKRIKIN